MTCDKIMNHKKLKLTLGLGKSNRNNTLWMTIKHINFPWQTIMRTNSFHFIFDFEYNCRIFINLNIILMKTQPIFIWSVR